MESSFSNLKFADDVVCLVHSNNDLQDTLKKLFTEAKKVGLRPNYSKTKLMRNREATGIQIDGNKLEYVEGYIYPG